MAIGDLASVVDLRAGAILFVLAAAHFAVAAQMGAFRDYCSRVCRHRVSDRVRDFFSPDHCPMGVAVWQPRLARGRRSARLVGRSIARIARRLAVGIALFVDANCGCGLAKQRPDETEIGPGRTARGRCGCDFGCADGDRFRWTHRACPEQCRSRVRRTNQLRTLHLPHPGSDGFQSLDAVANAIPDRDTISAFAGVRDCYAIHCGVVVAIFATTDKQAAWRKNEEGYRPDSGWKLGAGMRDEISTYAASNLQCGFIWINQPGADRGQFFCVL